MTTPSFTFGAGQEALNNLNTGSTSSATYIEDVLADPNLKLRFLYGNCTGRILPGFDNTLSKADRAYKTSTCSYRVAGSFDQETGQPLFGGFFIPAKMYIRACVDSENRQYTFLTPEIQPIGDGRNRLDPIVELRKYIYGARNNRNDTTYIKWVTPGTPTKDTPYPKAVLANAADVILLNVYCQPRMKENETNQNVAWENHILCLKQTARDQLFADLNAYRPPFISTPYDTKNPNYLLGDVTDPATGLPFEFVKRTKSGSGSPYGCLGFGDLNAATQSLIRPSGTPATAMPVGEDVLSKRYDLTDGSLYKFKSAQEIVQLVHAAGVPAEVIKLALESKMALPDLSKAAASTSVYMGGVAPAATPANLGGVPLPLAQPATVTTQATPPVQVVDPNDMIPGLGTPTPVAPVTPITQVVAPTPVAAPVAAPATAPTPIEATPAALTTPTVSADWTTFDQIRFDELTSKLSTPGMQCSDEEIKEFSDLNLRAPRS